MSFHVTVAGPVTNADGFAMRPDYEWVMDWSVFGPTVTITLAFDGKMDAAFFPGGLVLWASTTSMTATGELLADIDLPAVGTAGLFAPQTVTVSVPNPGILNPYLVLASFGGEQGEEEGFASVDMDYQNVDILVLLPVPDPGDTYANNNIIIKASETRGHGGLNRQAVVKAVPSSVAFSYAVLDAPAQLPYTETTGGKLLIAKAPDQILGVPGPYILDPVHGLSVTAIEIEVAQDLNGGQTYGSVELNTDSDANPALLFPDEIGYLCFKFGDTDVVGPVKYYGRQGDTALLLDASFRFPSSVPTGAMVTLLSSRTPWQPEQGETSGSFYATGSAAGRIAAQKQVRETVAAGLKNNIQVIYPGDRGLGGEGLPSRGTQKLSDKVAVWGGDDIDSEIPKARNE